MFKKLFGVPTAEQGNQKSPSRAPMSTASDVIGETWYALEANLDDGNLYTAAELPAAQAAAKAKVARQCAMILASMRTHSEDIDDDGDAMESATSIEASEPDEPLCAEAQAEYEDIIGQVIEAGDHTYLDSLDLPALEELEIMLLRLGVDGARFGRDLEAALRS